MFMYSKVGVRRGALELEARKRRSASECSRAVAYKTVRLAENSVLDEVAYDARSIFASSLICLDALD